MAYASPDQVSSPFTWQNELQDWTKRGGLQNYLQTGLQDSTINKSGFYDRATAEAQALRAKTLAEAQGIIGQAPIAGIDPATAVSALQNADAQAIQQRNTARQAGFANAAGQQQSTTDWINQMMGSTGQAVNAQQQAWQNYQQAMINQAAQKQAEQNALIGTGIAAAGTIGGAAVAGPIGAAIGGGLAGLGSKAVMPSGGYTPASSAPAAVQQQYPWMAQSYSGPSNNYS